MCSSGVRRHRDPGYRRHGQWRAAAGLVYLPGYGASCPSAFCPHHSHADRSRPPFFRALDALAVNDGRGWAGFAVSQLAAFNIKRVVDAIERAVVGPAAEVVVHRAARRQILRQRSPLAAGAQEVHQTVDNSALVDRALVAAAFGGWDQRLDPVPLIVGQVAGITQLAAVVATSVLVRPHAKAPPNRLAGLGGGRSFRCLICSRTDTNNQHVNKGNGLIDVNQSIDEGTGNTADLRAGCDRQCSSWLP